MCTVGSGEEHPLDTSGLYGLFGLSFLLGREEEGVDSRDGKIAQGRHLAPNVASVAVAV
jgi:hypothetical protein